MNTTFSDQGNRRRLPVPRRVAVLVAVACSVVVALWTLGTPSGIMGKAIAIGYAICHRIATRSFLIDGLPMPLCARCTGIYLGVMIGWLIMMARGRVRAGRLPRPHIIAVLAAFVVIMGIDGVNSYITLFPGVQSVYSPHNVLRLITGMYCGIAIIHVILPIFNTAVWTQADDMRSLDGWRDLAGVCAAAAVVIVLVLVERPLISWVLGVLSALGVMMLLTMVGTVLFLTFSRRDRAAARWRDLAIPALAGLTLALIQIGVIDILRFALTHTWDGFVIGG